MATSTMTALLPATLETVWSVVTERWDWRGDLDRVEVTGPRTFTEVTKDGFATNFTTTRLEPCVCWEFDLENQNLRGHWSGVFTAMEEGTQVVFTETVEPKKVVAAPLVKPFLRRQQAQYLADLRRVLEKETG